MHLAYEGQSMSVWNDLLTLLPPPLPLLPLVKGQKAADFVVGGRRGGIFCFLFAQMPSEGKSHSAGRLTVEIVLDKLNASKSNGE
jgi:hypothetical protein